VRTTTDVPKGPSYRLPNLTKLGHASFQRAGALGGYMAVGGPIPPKEEDEIMHSLLRTAARWTIAAVVALPLTASAAPIAARAVRPPAFVTPDTARTKAYFIKFGGSGSFALPTLNGLSGTITYDNLVADEKAKIYTAWGTYGTPPPPSNGGTIVAYLVMRFSFEPPVFGNTGSSSSITYAKLNPSKTYSIDVWDVTNTPSEVTLQSIGSPSNGTLSFQSPFNSLSVDKNYAVADLELVQNP
jgi:hypothetical protein